MLNLDIPGYKKLELSYLVLDYNGTLAIDGVLINGVREMLNALSDVLEIHIITADTFKKAENELLHINCRLIVLEGDKQSVKKNEYITKLGCEKVIVIGNGRNDALMLENAAIGIAVVQQEGSSRESVMKADIICSDIKTAFELIKNPLRIKATLRD